MSPPPFDPKNCKYGTWPNTPGKPWVSQGSTSSVVGYLQAVLKCTSGQSIAIAALPGPWVFSTSTKTGVKNFQRFFGLAVDGVVGPQTWGVIDWAAHGFPT